MLEAVIITCGLPDFNAVDGLSVCTKSVNLQVNFFVSKPNILYTVGKFSLIKLIRYQI